MCMVLSKVKHGKQGIKVLQIDILCHPLESAFSQWPQTWSWNQQLQNQLRTCSKGRISGTTPDLLKQRPQGWGQENGFHKPSSWFWNTLTFKDHWWLKSCQRFSGTRSLPFSPDWKRQLGLSDDIDTEQLLCPLGVWPSSTSEIL